MESKEENRKCSLPVKISLKSSSKGSSSNRIHLISMQMRKRKRRTKMSNTNYQAPMTKLMKIKTKIKRRLMLLSRHPPKQRVISKPWPTKQREGAILPMTTHLLKVVRRRAQVPTQLIKSPKRKILKQGSLKSKELMINSKIMMLRRRRARRSKTFLILMLAAMA